MKSLLLGCIFLVMGTSVARSDDFADLSKRYQEEMFIGYIRLHDIKESFRITMANAKYVSSIGQKAGVEFLQEFLDKIAIREDRDKSISLLYLRLTNKSLKARYKMMSDLGTAMTDLAWTDDNIKSTAILIDKFITNSGQLLQLLQRKLVGFNQAAQLVVTWQREPLVSVRGLALLAQRVTESLIDDENAQTELLSDLHAKSAFGQLRQGIEILQRLATQAIWPESDIQKFKELNQALSQLLLASKRMRSVKQICAKWRLRPRLLAGSYQIVLKNSDQKQFEVCLGRGNPNEVCMQTSRSALHVNKQVTMEHDAELIVITRTNLRSSEVRVGCSQTISQGNRLLFKFSPIESTMGLEIDVTYSLE
jgi:hypothetical protein